MIAKHGKRALSLFLAVIMIFSAVPFQAFAVENHDHSEENIVADSAASESTSEVTNEAYVPAEELAAQINAIVDSYGIHAEMTEDEIFDAMYEKSDDELFATMDELDSISEALDYATEEDVAYILTNADVEACGKLLEAMNQLREIAMFAASGSHKPVTGVTVGVSDATDNSMSNGAVTVTAKGSKGVFGIGASSKTATITVYNESGSKAKISFDWTASSVNELKIDGAVYSGSSGSFEKVLEAGENFVITITTAKNNTTNKLVMKNFAIAAVKESSAVTFQYDSELGSVTVAGNAVASGDAVDVPSSGAELKATAKNGGAFLGWIDASTRMIISKAATYTLEPADDMTVKAVFTKNACFLVNGNLLYEDLNEALTAASSGSNKTVILANSGILPAGNYTIPSGVTLLIPYNDANTLHTTAPGTTDASTYVAPTVYRKLTMAEGANIIINGAMSLSAVQSSSMAKSCPVGACSFVQMESGSSITVNKSGNLYVWGFIQGSGEVIVKNGATVYECFQVMDWRGGDNTSGMVDNSYRVFPFSQYYVQNVEVPMTLEAGATEKGYMSVAITLVGIKGSQVPFIGSDGMFNIDSGYIVKDYDETTGRLNIDVHGGLSIKSLSVSMQISVIGTKTINSKNYVLPINGNMTVTMHSGGYINMTQDVSLQPGARLIVEEGATCTLGDGNSIYVYDYDEWITAEDAANGEGPSFCSTGDAAYVNLPYPASVANNVPTRAQDAYVEINGTADLSAGYVYTTAGGANVRGTGTIKMRPGKADATLYQVKHLTKNGEEKEEKWFKIPITSAVLTNADGSKVVTANDKGLVTYTSVDGVWTCAHTAYVGEVTKAATCEAAGVKTFTCHCGETSYTEEIPALGHDEVAHEAKDPTCTEAGHEAYVSCSRCDYTTYEEVAALGHTPSAAADCENAQTCTVCGEELNAALGHTYNAVVTEPTCTEGGYTTYTCATCGHSYTDDAVEALGHTAGAEADCEKAQTCTVCGEELNAALGHKWEWVTDQEATVLKPGIKHEECSVCHAKQNENTEIPMLKCSHEGTMTTTEAQAETCTEAGNSKYYYCSACENYYSDAAGQHEIEKDSWIIAALGHDEVEHDRKIPSCVSIGWNAYVTCSRCDYSTYEELPINPDGHDKEFHGGKDATCTEIGWEAYATCKNCDFTSYVEKSALGHDEVEHEAKAPTCKTEGWDAYVTCSRCDYNTKNTLPADPDAHVWDEGEEYGNHSCNSPLRMKYKCTVKGCSKTTLVVIKEQHFRVPIAEEIPATCTTDGMTSGWKCEKCDEFWIPQEVIPALGHDWNGAYPCESDSSACTRCNTYFDTKQDHLAIVEPGTPATCTQPGLTDGAHCGFCGVTLTAQTEIPVTDHNWFTDEIEIPATCTTNGHKAGATYCLDCDYDEDPIPALDHSWMHRDAKKATYSAIGWNAHDYCLLCKATKTLEEYAEHSCEFCGENPEGYIEIPMVAVQSNQTYDAIISNLEILEMMAGEYAKQNPGTDPLGLVLNYMRTGVSNYTSGSWAIMAGPENKDFLKFVQEAEDTINSNPDLDVWVNVSGLKKLYSVSNPHDEENLYVPGSQARVLSGHFFGTMDMTYYNKGSQNHADVGGWVGDLTDLLGLSDEHGVPANLTLDEKVEYIRENYLFKESVSGSAGSFGSSDLYADLDAYYFANELITNGYEPGDLTALMREYYQEGLTLAKRVSYLLNNRLDGLSTRKDLRTAVYNAYTSNKLIATLEGTRNFNATGNELTELRKAVCYAFADEMCYRAGDYVEDLTNPRFTVFDTETKILAPGVSQQINYATNADGKQIVYYVATADVMRDDVGVWVNYYDRDPGTPENPEWKNNSVPSSAQNAQDRYGDPASEDYIENFNVIASTNAGGYDMSDVATPGGLVVMNGIEWYPQTTTAGFFAILDDGTAYMGKYDEYKSMMAEGRIKEAIGGFGEFVVMDGQVVGSATYSDAPRTSVGITATGRVVLMCIDGRQAPFSSGASLQDVGYIMKEAGCVVAINLDGGGSTTFVARQPGDDELSIMNRPSDGYPRNVSTNLLIYSTAPSSTKFDHAVIESEYDYATINTPVQMTAAGVSPAGNAVDIPEGATWAVSDEAWASITEDGVFTGKRLGEVTVYLMVDGQVVGTKLMTMTNADQVYFEKTKVDAIYGSSVVLPLRARHEGKPIAINPNDVTITLSAPNAGFMNGFTFTAVESTVKTMSITASLDENTKATINVMLYKQGENSFDFDKATGGDRMLAWDRQVSNAKVEDGNIYNVIDPSKAMVTSYTFALDMTALPIPERLEELTYMLPGGTVEGTNAWTFLTSLAQRISDLSWVKATIDFDDRFDVDYSELKVLNDYFVMKETQFDETTNTLTVTLGWIKQSQVIDAATANPLCMINGIKLTPKDGVWEDTTKINAVTSGEIGYEIYMRASGLYSFAQKPESQAVFGVYPYRNPADTTDAGGYFFDTYAKITDEYTLVNVLKEGWVNEDGGFAYYIEGERLTGVQKVEGFYYDFGEQGINVGQTKLTGLFYDETAEAYRYSYMGELAGGWQSINGEWYYFHSSTKVAASGRVRLSGVYYEFEETGKLVSGVWANTLKGTRYYYGPTYYEKYWAEIDGEFYFFSGGYVLKGLRYVRSKENAAIKRWYDFGDDGICRGTVSGLLKINGEIHYAVDGLKQIGLQKVDGDYYFFTYDGPAIVSRQYYAWETHCDLPCGAYAFGDDGKMVNGLAQMSDGLYYYVNGKVKSDNAGLTKIGDDYYFVNTKGKCVTGKYYAWATNCDLLCGEYEFGADGKMLNGLVEKEDGIYYYCSGKIDAKKAGLTKIGENYYFVNTKGKCMTGTYYCWATNCDLPCGAYEFAEDGKMLNGLVEKADGVYYYYNGKIDAKKAGLTKVGEDYYFVNTKGKCVTGTYYCWATNCDLRCGAYEFAEDGKMLNGLIEKEDATYYYYNGNINPNKAGLTKVGEDYYFVNSKGQCVTGRYYCWATNCDLPAGEYEFDANGKMLNGLVEKEDGLYCYFNGKINANKAGLTKIGEDYYFVNTKGQCVTGTYYCWATNCDLPCDSYEFGADGKMLHGLVEKDDGIYCYVYGKMGGNAGLIKLGDDYYFVNKYGQCVTGKYNAWATKCDLPIGTYEFGDDGKMLDGFVTKADGIYYYVTGKVAKIGLHYIDGYYYCVTSSGKLITNKQYYVWETNGLLLEQVYEFNELGQIVG